MKKGGTMKRLLLWRQKSTWWNRSHIL